MIQLNCAFKKAIGSQGHWYCLNEGFYLCFKSISLQMKTKNVRLHQEDVKVTLTAILADNKPSHNNTAHNLMSKKKIKTASHTQRCSF